MIPNMLPKFECCLTCAFFQTEPGMCAVCKSGEQYVADDLDRDGLEDLRDLQQGQDPL